MADWNVVLQDNFDFNWCLNILLGFIFCYYRFDFILIMRRRFDFTNSHAGRHCQYIKFLALRIFFLLASDFVISVAYFSTESCLTSICSLLMTTSVSCKKSRPSINSDVIEFVGTTNASTS